MTETWARYEFPGGHSPVPGLSHLVLRRSTAAEHSNSWIQLDFQKDRTRLFSISFLVTSLDFLFPGPSDTQILRYCIFPGEGAPLEFVSRKTGNAIPPKLGLLEHLLPRSNTHSDRVMPFFSEGSYLGQRIRKTETGTDDCLFKTEGVRKLSLDEEILIGTSRPFRDTGVGRLHPPGESWTEEDKDYEYTQLGPGDYQRMIEAGMNIFRVPAEHLDHVLEEPVFFLIRETYESSPDLLYRSNFLGSVMYMDEPAWLIMSNHLADQIQTPGAAATLLCELTRGRYEGNGNYGQRDLQKLLGQAGYAFSEYELLQPDYPCWETVASSAWYEMEAGIGGWCFESRIRPVWFSELVKNVLNVGFPSDPDACIRYHLALFAGAAGRFKGKWGVAVYGQTDANATELLFPMAYRRGASYFWFWTSDRAHHVPFEEQLAYTQAFRQFVERNQGAMEAAPATAVSFPWGYLCDQYTLNTYYDHAEPRMWFSRHMALDSKNASEVPYGKVLQTGMQEVAHLLESDTPFDILFLKEGELAPEYETLIRVNEDASLDRVLQ